MTKKMYQVKYLGQGHVVDEIEASSKTEAINRIVVKSYFMAKVKGEKW